MDVLLINTPVIGTKRTPDSEESVPPIGIGYIYTQLILAGYECKFVDAAANGYLQDETLQIINESNAKYIGLNVFSSNLSIVRFLLENVESPRNFFLGGPATRALVSVVESWNPNGNITLVTGEAELILPEIIRHPELAEIHSSKVNIVNVTPESHFYPLNIDLPLDRTIFENEPIKRDDLGLIESHIIASRGCLYNCAFCTAARSINTQINPRYRTYDKLIEEIENIRKSHLEVNSIRVLDDLFLRDQSSIELAIKLFTGNKLYWRSMAHINTFHDLPSQSLERIKYSGCRELFIGIESGNDKTLKHIRKPFSVEKAYNTVCHILDSTIPVKCYFILGFPGETESDVRDTVMLASRICKYAAKINVRFRISPFQFRPYYGTALYDEIIKKGQIITQIHNRADMSETSDINPFDCVAGIYSEYDQNTLNKYMLEIEKLNTSN